MVERRLINLQTPEGKHVKTVSIDDPMPEYYDYHDPSGAVRHFKRAHGTRNFYVEDQGETK